MATLGLKEMGKFLWEGREKSLPSWLFQFSFAKLRQPIRQTFLEKITSDSANFVVHSIVVYYTTYYKIC